MSTSIDEIKKVLEREREARERDKQELLEALRESRKKNGVDPKSKLRSYFENADDPKAIRERRKNRGDDDDDDE